MGTNINTLHALLPNQKGNVELYTRSVEYLLRRGLKRHKKQRSKNKTNNPTFLLQIISEKGSKDN